MAEAKHTKSTWTCKLARMREDAPIFGFMIVANGKVPYVASAGVAPPDHALIVPPDMRHLVQRGFTEEEVEANGKLLAAAPDLLAALRDARRTLLSAIEAGNDGIPDFDPTQHVTVKKIDAAIAKAEGAGA